MGVEGLGVRSEGWAEDEGNRDGERKSERKDERKDEILRKDEI